MLFSLSLSFTTYYLYIDHLIQNHSISICPHHDKQLRDYQSRVSSSRTKKTPTLQLPTQTAMASTILPLELVDRCIGSPIWVLMKNEREFTGTLMGFDDYVSE